MRRCFYHTDLGQNAVLNNFATQIALIQYSGRLKITHRYKAIMLKRTTVLILIQTVNFSACQK